MFWGIRQCNRIWPSLSAAYWVPFLWLLIIGSRSPSFWFGVAPSGGDLEGNAFDRNLYLVLGFLSVAILQARNVKWGRILSNNPALVFLYLYLLASCLWSDYPEVSFKRWSKDLLALFVGLVIVSQHNARETLEAIGAKCAIVLYSLSVLFLKYYPDFGRRYSRAGGLEVTGVTDQKNALGAILLVFGAIVIWSMQGETSAWLQLPKRTRRILQWTIIGMGFWLLGQADSKTSIVCLGTALAILFSDRIPLIGKSPKTFLTVVAIGIPLLVAGNEFFHLKDEALKLLHRNPTLTGRTVIWEAIKEHPVDSLFGGGYLIYWDVHNPILIDGYEAFLKTVHNGYLEIYLDGGWIAVLLLITLLATCGLRIAREFLTGSDYGRLQLAFFAAVLLFNLGESTFVRRDVTWFMFLLVCSDFRGVFPAPPEPVDESNVPEPDRVGALA